MKWCALTQLQYNLELEHLDQVHRDALKTVTFLNLMDINVHNTMSVQSPQNEIISEFCKLLLCIKNPLRHISAWEKIRLKLNKPANIDTFLFAFSSGVMLEIRMLDFNYLFIFNPFSEPKR